MPNNEDKKPKIIPQKLRLPFIEKLTFIESLSIMLSSGIPILEALEAVKDDSLSKNSKSVIGAVIDSVQSGQSLAESFSQFPAIFDPIFINTVKAGEESGNLDKVLLQLVKNLRDIDKLKSDVKAAMLYPAIVLGVLAVVLVVLFGFVVPRVAVIFTRLNVPKPLPTRIFLAVALSIHRYYLIFGLGIAILAALTLFLFSNKSFRERIITLGFRLPFFSGILRYVDLSRFSSTLALLLSAGVPIIEGVERATTVVVNKTTKEELGEVAHKLTGGKSLAGSLREYKTFPALMSRIIGTGEKTGNLDKVLSEVSVYYQDKLEREIKSFSVVLEPALIIIVGVIVAAVILSIIAPIYQLISQINPT